jgi:hypothetical protein
MTRAGTSIFYFGFWVVVCGVSLMFFPEFCLGVAGITLPDYVTARILGLVHIYLAVYYFVASRYPAFRPFYVATIVTRSTAPAIVIVLVLLGMVKPATIGFTAVDALGALWTGLALRKDGREKIQI